MSESHMPKVGEVVVYTDEVGVEHDALVTAYWSNQADGALNCVYISSDDTKSDSYGRQSERASSVSRQHEGSTAHGRFWNPKS